MKEEFEICKRKRARKQFVSGGIFPVVLVAGWFYPFLGYFIPLCMLLGIGIGISRGRKWCNWLCPRGSFQDAFIRPISPQKKIPLFLRGMPFRTGIIVFFLFIITMNLISRWPDPGKIGAFFVILLIITTAIGLVLSFFIHQRSWCSFCPIGTIVNLAGRNKLPLRIDANLCSKCGACDKVCPMQISPYQLKKDSLESGDCLKCGLCIANCPKKALER